MQHLEYVLANKRIRVINNGDFANPDFQVKASDVREAMESDKTAQNAALAANLRAEYEHKYLESLEFANHYIQLAIAASVDAPKLKKRERRKLAQAVNIAFFNAPRFMQKTT